MEIFHHQTSRLQATQKALEQPFKEVSNFASVESTKELLLSLKNPQRWENVVHYTVGKITIFQDLKNIALGGIRPRDPSHISNLEVLGSNPGGFKSFFDVTKIADFG